MRLENDETATHGTVEKMNAAKRSIKKGLSLFTFSIIRLFLEAWVVQEIWNYVVTDIVKVSDMTYWYTFLMILMFRIIMGQFKITMPIGDKDNNNNGDKDNNNNVKK